MAVTATAADYVTVAQQLYIAYFGRPADAFGLTNMTQALAASGAPTDEAGFSTAYATNSTVKAIIDNFGTSKESTALYGSGTTSSFVTAIFQNVLGRDPLIAGLEFWVNAIDQGVMTKAQAAENILAAAVKTGGSAADAATVAAKLAVANAFTTDIDTAAEVNGYTGAAAAAAARAMLHGVDGTTDASTYASLASSTLANIVTGSVVVTNTLLTVNADALVGGNGNDNFVGTLTPGAGGAPTDTLNAFDSIDGGAGSNSLTVAFNGAEAGGDIAALGLQLKNIQTLNVTNAAATVLSNGDTAGFSTVKVTGTVANITVNSAAATTVSTINGLGVTVNDAAATTVSVSGATGVVAVNSDALTTLNLTNIAGGAAVTAAAGTRALTINANGVIGAAGAAVAVSDTTATSVTINDTGAASNLTLAIDAATALTLGGAKEVDFAAATGTSFAALAKATITGSGGVEGDLSGAALLTAIDASASTGKNVIAVDGTHATYVGGSGVDIVSLAVTATKSIDGGAGTADVLVLNGAAGVAQVGTHTTGFEVLGLGINATGSYDATGFSALTHGVVAGPVTFTGLTTGATLTLTDAPTADTTVVLAADGTADVLNVVVTSDITINAGGVVATGFETINVTSTDTADTPAAVHLLAIHDATATTLTVGGNTGITLDTTDAAAIATFDASGNTTVHGAGGVTYVSTNVTTSVSLKGGTGDDVLDASATIATKSATIDGGAGNNTLTGGLGSDTIKGGAGNDIITGGGKGDTLTGGGGNNVFHYTNTTDSAPSTYDTITDFHAKTATVNGDVLHLDSTIFGGAAGVLAIGTVSVAANGSLALAALGADAHTTGLVNFALDASTGTLYIDGQGVGHDHIPDGTADMAIILTGVTTITASAISVA